VTARVRKRSKRLAQALADAGTLYAPEPLHDVRIAAKKLRYTLELARAAGDAGVARDIGTLKRLQRLLGRLNDLEGLQQYVRDASAVCGDAGISAGMSAMQRQLEAECRQLHGRFLARAAQWMGIAERGARALPPLLGGTRAVKAASPRLRLVRREKSA
jgi:CHAD domain-containing protein